MTVTIGFLLLFKILSTTCDDSEPKSRWYCTQEPDVIFRGLYRNGKYWNILASSSGEKWAESQMNTINGPLKGIRIREARKLSSRPSLREGIVIDKDSPPGGYTDDKQVTIFNQTLFFFQAEYENFFVFGGYMQTLFECPPVYCLDATLDAVDYIENKVRFFRLTHFWHISEDDESSTQEASDIDEEYPQLQGNIDAIMSDDIGQYIYKENSLHLYLKKSDLRKQLTAKLQFLDDRMWQQFVTKLHDTEDKKYVEIELKDSPFNMTNIDGATIVKSHSNSFALHLNQTHWWILEVSSLWKMIIRSVSGRTCDLSGNDQLCSYNKTDSVREVTDYTVDVSDGTNSVYHVGGKENTSYRFVDKWYHYDIPLKSLTAAILNPSANAILKPMIALEEVFNCSKLLSESFKMSGENYTKIMYEYMSPRQIDYDHRDVLTAGGQLDLRVVVPAAVVSLLIIMGGGSLLFKFAPEEAVEDSEKTTSTTSAPTPKSASNNSEEDEVNSRDAKDGNLAAELLQMHKDHIEIKS